MKLYFYSSMFISMVTIFQKIAILNAYLFLNAGVKTLILT